MRLFKPDVERLRARNDVDGLIKALNDPSAEVRIKAAYALGNMGDRRAVDGLIERLGEQMAASDKNRHWHLASSAIKEQSKRWLRLWMMSTSVLGDAPRMRLAKLAITERSTRSCRSWTINTTGFAGSQ